MTTHADDALEPGDVADSSHVGSSKRLADLKRFSDLRRFEARLETEWQELQAKGHGYARVRDLLAKGASSEEETSHALHGAQRSQNAFLSGLDDLLRRLHAHFLAQVVGELERAMETMGAFYGPRRIRGVRRRYRRLAELAQRYHTLEDLYGTAKDHKRIVVFQRFYAGVVAFSEEIRRLDPTMPRRSPPSLWDLVYRVRRAGTWLVGHGRIGVRLVVAFVRAVATAVSARSQGPGTPFTSRVDEFFRALGELRDLDVVVHGRENLAWQGTERSVALFAPTHRHGETDNITFAHLALPDYLVFNAIDQVQLLPRFLKERIAKTRGLIAVGGGRGPAVDRALEAIRAQVSRNILIYPEGSVSEGFRGTRPARSGFGESLVRRIREDGFDLQIVPVSYLDNARFLDLPPRSGLAAERRRRVAVSPPLDSTAIDALLEAGGGELLNRMVRLAWLESLVTDETLFLGQDRVSAIEARLDRELDGVRYWGSVEPAPTPDRLTFESEDPVLVHDVPFQGKRVRVLEVPASARDARGRIPLPDLERADSNELILGIRPPSHIYLAVGSQRFDGDIFRPLKVKERSAVFPGILIRFLGVPMKSLNAIRRELEGYAGREQRTLSCANSACQVIARAANIEIDDHADMRPFVPSHVLPTRTIRKLIERGVVNHAGEPIEVQIYNTDGRSLETILAEMRRAEIRIAKDHVWMATAGALRTGVDTLRKLAGTTKGPG